MAKDSGWNGSWSSETSLSGCVSQVYNETWVSFTSRNVQPAPWVRFHPMPLLSENLYRDCRAVRLLALIYSLLSFMLLPLALVLAVLLAFEACVGSAVCVAQLNQTWQVAAARPYVLRGAERRLLDRAERFLADEQWDDGIGALIRLLESENFSVVASSAAKGESKGVRLHISLSEYCHRLLANLPAEPLARYRILVDARAESWYRRGIAERDSKLLQQVVGQCFCSQWGDDALMALGEFALQQGDYQAAREAWLRVGGAAQATVGMLVYPETDLRLVDVRARLVLCAIRAGDLRLAELELGWFLEDFPQGRGRLGGREVELGAVLAGLLKQARRGSRGSVGGDRELGEEAWSADVANVGVANAGVKNAEAVIVPAVVNGLVVCQDEGAVRAWKLSDGEAVFAARGAVFQSSQWSSRWSPKLPSKFSSEVNWMGRPRFALTANERFVFGVTKMPLGRHQANTKRATSTLWCVDLQRDGALALQLTSDESGVSFVGPPVVQGSQLWVPLASNGQAARAGIASYDLSTGQRRWQRWLCQANTPMTGLGLELVNKQLTFDSGILYVNTNLGAIAAVRAEDGQILWLRTYQRDNTTDYYRGPSPCVYHRGVLFVLPTDSKHLLALDAMTGSEIWRTLVLDATARLIDVTDERVLLDAHGAKAFDRYAGKPIETDEQVPPEAQVIAGDFLIRVESSRLRAFHVLNRPAADAVESPLP